MNYAGLYPKADKGNRVFYCPGMMNYQFSMPKLGPDGKKIVRCNPITGLPLNTHEGVPDYVEESVKFKPWKTKFSEDGYCCVYEVTKDTDPAIVAELEKDAKNRSCKIVDEQTYIEMVNPALAEKIKEDASVAAENRRKDELLKKQSDEIEQLRKRLGGSR